MLQAKASKSSTAAEGSVMNSVSPPGGNKKKNKKKSPPADVDINSASEVDNQLDRRLITDPEMRPEQLDRPDEMAEINVDESVQYVELGSSHRPTTSSSFKFRITTEGLVSLPNTDWSFDVFRDAAATEAKRLIRDVFPCRIYDLKRLIRSSNFSRQRLDDINHIQIAYTSDTNDLDSASTDDGVTSAELDDDEVVEPPSKMNRLEPEEEYQDIEADLEQQQEEEEDELEEGEEDGLQEEASIIITEVGVQPDVVELLRQLKPLLFDLWESATKVCQWIQLSIPPEDERDPLCDEVQQRILDAAQDAQDFARQSLAELSVYHNYRGDDIADMLDSADSSAAKEFERAIIEHDKSQFLRAQQMLVQIHADYAILTNCIVRYTNKFDRTSPSAVFYIQ